MVDINTATEATPSVQTTTNSVPVRQESILSKEIDIAQVEQIARNAGTIIAEYREKGVELSFKASDENVSRQVQTEADLASERFLKLNLLALHGCDFYGEEEGGKLLDSGDQWVVDPLDGTENLMGYPPVLGVSIGLMRDGKPYMGVIYDVMSGTVFAAEVGKGARMNGREIHVSEETDPKRAIVAMDFSSKASTRPVSLAQMGRVLETARSVKTFGAPVLALSAVAAGQLEVFSRPSTKPPDMVAGVVIAQEAGAKVLDYDGKPYDVRTSKGIVVGPPAMVDAYMPCFLPQPSTTPVV